MRDQNHFFYSKTKPKRRVAATPMALLDPIEPNTTSLLKNVFLARALRFASHPSTCIDRGKKKSKKRGK